MNVEQCRAARALLGWSAQELADEAKVGVATVRRYEGGIGIAAASIAAMVRTFEDAGIVFVADGEASAGGGPGVRLAAD
jgi:transcriptional regulator with XRE-family HTH domain